MVNGTCVLPGGAFYSRARSGGRPRVCSVSNMPAIVPLHVRAWRPISTMGHLLQICTVGARVLRFRHDRVCRNARVSHCGTGWHDPCECPDIYRKTFHNGDVMKTRAAIAW